MNDWKARAEREAAALLDASDYMYLPGGVRNASEAASRNRIIDLLALSWLQGAIFASHLDLQALEMGADDLKAAL